MNSLKNKSTRKNIQYAEHVLKTNNKVLLKEQFSQKFNFEKFPTQILNWSKESNVVSNEWKPIQHHTNGMNKILVTRFTIRQIIPLTTVLSKQSLECATHHKLSIHFSSHQHKVLVLFQVRVEVQNQLAWSIFSQSLQGNQLCVLVSIQPHPGMQLSPSAGLFYLNIDEGGEMQLLTSPLTQKEFVSFFPGQSVHKLLEKQHG